MTAGRVVKISHLFGRGAVALVILTGALACTADPVQTQAAVASDVDPVTRAENDRVQAGAAWTQYYFPSSDGSDVELHADVLLPEAPPEGERVPVILSVGSYFGHAGETKSEGLTHTGPSARFDDFIEGTDLFARGYAFVRVDLRGFVRRARGAPCRMCQRWIAELSVPLSGSVSTVSLCPLRPPSRRSTW